MFYVDLMEGMYEVSAEEGDILPGKYICYTDSEEPKQVSVHVIMWLGENEYCVKKGKAVRLILEEGSILCVDEGVSLMEI